jgi:hypothetical protein
MEHRWGQRRVADLTVRFVVMPCTIDIGRLTNISASGAFLETVQPLRHLTLVYLQPIDQPSLKGAGLIAATVIRHEATGFGLEWCETAAAVRQLQTHATESAPPTRPATPNPAHIFEAAELYHLEFLD